MFVLFGAVIVLAASALVYAAGSLVAGLLAARRSHAATPVADANRLFFLQVMPAAAALAAAVLCVLPAYAFFEPRDGSERFGFTAGLLAAAAALAICFTAARLARAFWETRLLATRWRASAERLDVPLLPVDAYRFDHPYPVVSVVGVFRPQVFVSRTVMETFTPPELRAAFLHELSHLDAWDNVKRLIVRSLPKAPWPSRRKAIQAEWEQALEESADARASAADPLDLASALLKAARLAARGAAPEPAAVYLYNGSGLERRIRRLTQSARPIDAARRRISPLALGTIASLALLMSPPAMRGVHELIEALVRLP